MKNIYIVLAFFVALTISCEKPSHPVPGGDNPQEEQGGEQGGEGGEGGEQGGEGQAGEETPVTVSTATLSFDEFESVDVAKQYVAGYGAERNYTNAYGTWTICAYYYNGGFQINSGKVAYIGTPAFPGNITEMEITAVSTTPDNYYICSESGKSSVAGLLQTVPISSSTTSFTLDGKHNQVFIRADGCARISRIVVTYGGTSGGNTGGEGEGEGGEGEGGGNTGGESGCTGGEGTGGGGTPVVSTGGVPGWYELPAINMEKSGDYLKDSERADVWYAFHKFSNGGQSYRNYTVCYSGEHHCPLWVAAPRHSCYEGTSGRSDAYGQDSSIPSNIQYSSKSTGGGCNKGHMLGSKERTCCSEANRQVFYYPNIAPQLSSGFNTGGGGWNLLEDFVDGLVVRDTLYEVVGCYFDSYTDGYGKTASPSTIEFGGRSDVHMPTMFYYAVLRTKKGTTGKCLSDCAMSELQCVAFVRTHTNSLKGQNPSSRELMSISDLEKLTGFTYFSNVPQAPKSVFSASDWGL